MSILPAPPTGTAYVYTAFSDIINAAWDLANTKATDYETKIANASGTWLDPSAAPAITPASQAATSVAEPSVYIPSSVSTSTISTEFGTQYAALVTLLANEFTLFMGTWFPSEGAVYSAAESWLAAEIANPDRVLPATLATQIWGEDQARIMDDASRATADVLATFASRRFPLPPGAAASATLQIAQKSQDELAASSRAVAVKTFEMAYDKLKFAVEKALSLRGMALNAAGDYIKALASGPDIASRVIGIGYDAQSKLISAVSQFYGARTDAAKLAASVDSHNADLQQDASKANQLATLELTKDKLQALIAEAQSLAQLATSLYNNLHANAGINGSDNVNWSK